MATNKNKWPVWLFIAALSIGFTYSMYSAFTQTGLGGYVSEIQMEMVGSADDYITVLVCVVLMFISVGVLVSAIDKIAPSLKFEESLRNSMKSLSQSSGLRILPKRRIFAIAAVPLLAGILIGCGFVVYGFYEHRQTVYTVDLAASSVEPKGARYLSVVGVAQGHAAAGYKEVYGSGEITHHHFYIPITSETWTPDEPVRYIVYYHYSAFGAYTKVEVPTEFSEITPTVFRGKVSGNLPVHIARQLKSMGVKVDPSYSVIDWGNLPEDQYVEPDTALGMGAVFGSIVSLLIVISLWLVNLQRKRFVHGLR